MKLQYRFCKKQISLLIKGKCPRLFGQCSLPTVNGDDVEYQDMYTNPIPVDRNEKKPPYILAKLFIIFFTQKT
jgi:hypothetical protein